LHNFLFLASAELDIIMIDIQPLHYRGTCDEILEGEGCSYMEKPAEGIHLFLVVRPEKQVHLGDVYGLDLPGCID